MDTNVNPKVSVLMPVYNAGNYLREAIDSVLNQTFTDFELIIVNDGSTDGSDAIIRSYLDPRIRYTINNQNMGVVFSRNRALKLAIGDYVASMDADDVCLPERLEKQFSFMEKNINVGVLGSSFEFSNGRIRSVLTDSKLLITTLAIGSCFAASTVMIRRSILTEHSIFYQQKFIYSEDYGLWVQLSQYTDLAAIPEVLLKYRVHPESITFTFSEQQRAAALDIREGWYEWILNRPMTFKEKSFLRGDYSDDQTIKSGWELIQEVARTENPKINTKYYLVSISSHYELIFVNQIKSFTSYWHIKYLFFNPLRIYSPNSSMSLFKMLIKRVML